MSNQQRLYASNLTGIANMKLSHLVSLSLIVPSLFLTQYPVAAANSKAGITHDASASKPDLISANLGYFGSYLSQDECWWVGFAGVYYQYWRAYTCFYNRQTGYWDLYVGQSRSAAG